MPGSQRPSVSALAWLSLFVGASATPASPAAAPSARAAVPAAVQRAAATPADTARERGAGAARSGLPLEPTRSLRYTAREGTWLSLDVSADGRTIVFDFLGDLYTIPMEGGAATRLTHGMAFDAQPRFSPDGSRIVFTSDRDGGENLWILSLDLRDTVQVTRGKTHRYQSPAWTPDGNYIVASRTYLRTGMHKLWMFHVDGGTGLQLVRGAAQLKTVGPAFGADPRYIWFSQRMGDWQYNARFPQYQLAVLDRETGEIYPRSARYGSAFRPTLSPDGRWLVYGTRHDADTGLRIRDLRTGEERWLLWPVQPDDQESRATRDVLPGMAFTPDSRALVASFGGGIWRVPIDGSAPTRIPFEIEVDLALAPEVHFRYAVDDAQHFAVRQIRDAVPSPDGRRLAFSALGKVWVMDYPDGMPRRVTAADQIEHQPTWSPDGVWIAFVSWAGAEGHVWRVQADGRRRPERVSRSAGYYRDPVYSPDGNRIVVIRSPAQQFQEAPGAFGAGMGAEFVWLPARGGEATLIAPTRGRSSPHFAGDAGRIHASGPGGTLVSFRWDGTDPRVHVRVTGPRQPGADNPATASTLLMAPQGERALARVLNDLYVVTVPVVGLDTLTISVTDPATAAFPVRKLTEVGGEFPRWSGDGERVHFSLGNAHFVYDLEAARAAEDSARAARRARAREPEPDAPPEEPAEPGDPEEQPADDPPDASPERPSEEPAYRPSETRIRIQAVRDIPRGVAVLRGGRAITMNGREVIEDADIVVRDNRIEAVGARGRVEVPRGAEVIDIRGRTVVPGFVDTHAHMWPPRDVHKDQVWLYLANLAYGVTTTRDPQTGTTDVLTYADRVDAGEIPGPRVFSTGPGVFATDPPRDLEHARRMLRRYSDYYDTKTIKMYVAGNREQRQWIIMAARELGLMPTTEGSLNFKLNLTQLLDGYSGQEHNIPVHPLYEDVVRLFREAGTAYTPTLLVTYGGPFGEEWFFSREDVHDDEKLRRFTPHAVIDGVTLRRDAWFHEVAFRLERHAEFAGDLIRAGGRVGVGSHGQLQGLGYHWELWAMQSGGMDRHDALRAATILGAESIGLDGDIGSLEAGKLADLVVLSGDPLRDIRETNTLVYVMKNGRLYDADTLDEVWPERRPLPPQHWHEPEPERAGWDRVTARP